MFIIRQCFTLFLICLFIFAWYFYHFYANNKSMKSIQEYDFVCSVHFFTEKFQHRGYANYVLHWTSELQTHYFHCLWLLWHQSPSLVHDSLYFSFCSFLHLYWLNHEFIDNNKNNAWFKEFWNMLTSEYRIIFHIDYYLFQ